MALRSPSRRPTVATRALCPDQKRSIRVRGRRLSWVDFGGSGSPMVALHGSFGREFPAAGHWIHDDDPEGCANAILRFLTGLALPSMGNL